MEEQITYRGRTLSNEDIEFICNLIKANPEASRWRLSKLLCEAWDWRHPNGGLQDMLCRGLMLHLHRGGHIQLPAPKWRPRKHPGRRRKPATDFLVDQSDLEEPLSTIRPLEIRQVRRAGWEEKLFDGLIELHHYLGYARVVGEQLKYIVYFQDRPVACMAWSSPPWHMGPRDRFIGWSPAVRKKNLHFIAYNTRYLILPWVRVKHLASHVLGSVARRISADWEELYAHPVYYLETFVDRERFEGTCYRAANWQCLGKTTGRGIKNKTQKVLLSKKDVLGYPLSRDFRERLGAEAQ